MATVLKLFEQPSYSKIFQYNTLHCRTLTNAYYTQARLLLGVKYIDIINQQNCT